MVDKEENNIRSVFNEAVMGIQRLGNSWQRCNYYSRAGNLESWREELRVIWRELSKYTNNITEGEKIKEKIDIINSGISKAFQKRKRLATYKLLEKKEIMLRELQERAGKGDVYREDDLDEIDI